MSRRFPDDVERSALAVKDRVPVEAAPVAEPQTPAEWLRANLFSSPFNSVVTIVVGALVAWLGYGLLHWVFVTADWRVFKANLASYMLGRFPRDEVWRVWAALAFVVALGGLSWGMTGHRLDPSPRRRALRVLLGALTVLLLVYLLDTVPIWLLIGGVTAIFVAAVAVGRARGRSLRKPLIVAWLLAFPLVIVILRSFGGVPSGLWGGLLLNVMVASVAIVLSFPLGILLGLGRRSLLPAVSTFSVGFIEFVRGAPLFTWLLFGHYVLPLILPPGLQLPALFRAIIMIIVFSSAYVAEIVRGGLQGVPAGQYEASRALGLSTARMMGLVVLPQALRSTIPAMIGHFISVWKDTALLTLVAGFVELLRSARRASAGLEFIGDQKEALIPAAFMFWVVAFSMSRWSQRLERQVGVGER